MKSLGKWNEELCFVRFDRHISGTSSLLIYAGVSTLKYLGVLVFLPQAIQRFSDLNILNQKMGW